eukprot:363841-Chlamydomonas_euryale.AAC.12
MHVATCMLQLDRDRARVRDTGSGPMKGMPVMNADRQRGMDMGKDMHRMFLFMNCKSVILGFT